MLSVLIIPGMAVYLDTALTLQQTSIDPLPALVYTIPSDHKITLGGFK
jgi:hypothetical protein